MNMFLNYDFEVAISIDFYSIVQFVLFTRTLPFISLPINELP